MYLVQLEEWERDLIVAAIKCGVENTSTKAMADLIKKLDKPKEAEIKLGLHIFVQNNGDGSASPVFFNTRKEAEDYAGEDDERLCDDIMKETIILNGLGQIKDIPKQEEN